MSFASLEKFNKQFEKGNRTVGQILKEEGQGGFSFYFPSSDRPDVSSLADAIEKALPHLTRVVMSPYIVLKSEYQLTRTEQASSLTPQGIQMTVKDPKLWKMKDGKLRPEYVYAKTNEDEYNTYENRVVFALIEKALRSLDIPTENAKDGVANMYEAYFQSATLNKLDLVKLIDPELYRASDAGSFDDYKKLVYLRGRLNQLRGSAFYKIMSRAPRFSGMPEVTNLFLHHPDYHACFMLWRFLDDFNSGLSLLTPPQRLSVYRAFVSLYMIGCYVKSGFRIEKDVVVKRADENFTLKQFVLKNEFFYVILNAEGNKIEILVQCPKVRSQQRTTVGLHTDIYEPYEKAHDFVVSLHKTDYSDRTACVVPNNRNSHRDLESIVRCTVLTFDADKEVYNKICPVCGSNAVENKDLYFRCEDCGAVYSFPDPHKVWLNRFRTLSENADRNI